MKFVKILFLSFVLASFLISPPIAMADEEKDFNPDEMVRKITEILDKEDIYRVMEVLSKGDDPVKVADEFFILATRLFDRDEKMSRVLAVSRMGIQYALTRARENEKKDVKTTDALLDIAKSLSYNSAMYTWIRVLKGEKLNPEDIKQGLEAAKLNLRLSEELKKNTEILSNDHFLLGVQYILNGDYEKAADELEKADEGAKKLRGKLNSLMAQGYLAVAEIMARKEEGKKRYDKVMEELKNLDEKGAPVVIQQIKETYELIKKPIPKPDE